MRNWYTALIHIRDPLRPSVRRMIESMLELIRGVEQVTIEPADMLIAIRFDAEKTGLADIVRLIEDSGVAVSSVAQR